MRIVIVGAGGRLGSALVRNYRERFDLIGFDHQMLDLEKDADVAQTIGALDFDVLINAAAFTNVDRCETEPDRAFRINAQVPKRLEEICRTKKARLIHFSTDYVFDGEKREPYTEDDIAKPVSVYGESKRAGEKFVLESDDRHLVVRVSWVFGPDRPSFVDAMIKQARETEHVEAIADKISTPTSTRDIAEALPRFFDVKTPGGTLHFANTGQCSWNEYAQHALDCCAAAGIELKTKSVAHTKLSDMKQWLARRPVYSALSTAKYAKITGITPRSWRDAVADYIERSYLKK